jgi:hypothetical protein
MEFGLMFVGIACGVPVIMAVMGLLTWLLVTWMGGLFRSSSGWDELARRFPGAAAAPQPLQKTSIRLGNVFYRFGTGLAVTPGGLYLVFNGAYRYPALLIPWREIKNPQQAILYWQPAWRVDLGDPLITQLTVKEAHYLAMKPYLEQ